MSSCDEKILQYHETQLDDISEEFNDFPMLRGNEVQSRWI